MELAMKPTRLPPTRTGRAPRPWSGLPVWLCAFALSGPTLAARDAPSVPRRAESQTDAERITSLLWLIDSDEEWYKELSDQRVGLKADYEQDSRVFAELDRQLSDAWIGQEVGLAESPGEEELSALEAARREARDRFDAIIKRKKALDRKLVTLEAKLALERELLDNLRSGGRMSPSDSTPPGSALLAIGSNDLAGEEPAAPPRPGRATPTPAGEARSEQAADVVLLDSDVASALDRLEDARTRLLEAQRAVDVIDSAFHAFSADLESTRALRDAARAEVTAAEQELSRTDIRRAGDESSGATGKEDTPGATLEPVERRLADARDRLVWLGRRMVESERMVAEMEDARAKAIEETASAQGEVASAERSLAFVRSPVAPQRLVRWITQTGPGVLAIVVLMVVLRWLAGFVARGVIGGLVRRGRHTSRAAREERAETLSRVFRSTATVVVVLAGSLAVLNEAGMDVTVLLGGAAVLGAAVAFGSQSLIKDYFSGFMVLVENQYSVGNVVQIGSMAGVVEDITLRVTVLRDLEGVVHFIPHSQLNTVSNLTFGWSRAMFDVGIAYKENVDEVIGILNILAREMRTDATYGPMILDEPEMLGVDAFADSAVVIRFLVKTRPLDRWKVKRELLRRIKLRFDELGIEIPFPHRTVFHRGFGSSEPPESEPRL